MLLQGFSELLGSLVTTIEGVRLHPPMAVADGEKAR